MKQAFAYRTLQSFTEASGWNTSISRALAPYHITGYMERITPGQFLEGVSFLLRAGQQVTIEQTEAHKFALKEIEDGRSAREKLSDALSKKLASQLTKEQKEKIAKGQEVALSLNSMSKELKALAIQYMDIAKPSGVSLDTSRFNEFDIVFLPPPSVGLGVNGYSDTGEKIGY